MSDIINKLICLNLNKSWKPVGYKTVKDAITSLTGGSDDRFINLRDIT